jgi:uncharacterized protein RhaS with RHS repeats
LIYMRNRYYDPATGKFTQEDPIGLAGGLNPYGFAGGDPINFSDPFGLRADSVEFANAETETAYNEMKATLAEQGDNEALGMLETLENDPRTFEVDMAPGPIRWFKAKIRGSAYTRMISDADAANGLGGSLSVVAGRRHYGRDVRMIHELGHVYFNLTESLGSYAGIDAWKEASNSFSVQMENIMRNAKGCLPRSSHQVAGPYCP